MDTNGSKRRSTRSETEGSNKRAKLEADPSGGLDEIDSLLSQQTYNSQLDTDSLDFGNLPDDLLDTIDQSVATPDLSRAGSRAATPQVTINNDDLKRQMAPKSAYNQQELMLPRGGGSIESSENASQQQAQSQSQPTNLHSNDPTKLNDALAAAGVDIQQEEELLLQQRNRMNINQYSQPVPRNPANNFLHPYHVSSSMQKSAREHGVIQNFLQDPEILELMSSSCEQWLSNIIQKTLTMARHRQNSAPIGKSKVGSGKSDLYQELRALAKKHREQEEKRVEKRTILGLEKGDENGKDDKAGGSEEVLHRAANATAAMMTMNPGRKKYSWMTAGGGSTGGPAPEKENSRRSHLLTLRGENGIRVNNTRITQAVTMKDLLSAIEDERMGVSNAVIKGYSKLRD